MHKDLLKHTLVLVQLLFSTKMRDRGDVLNWDKLSKYDLDDLVQSVFVARETLAVLEILYHFAHEVLEYQ
jgi:hypothetical protein